MTLSYTTLGIIVPKLKPIVLHMLIVAFFGSFNLNLKHTPVQTSGRPKILVTK